MLEVLRQLRSGVQHRPRRPIWSHCRLRYESAEFQAGRLAAVGTLTWGSVSRPLFLNWLLNGSSTPLRHPERNRRLGSDQGQSSCRPHVGYLEALLAAEMEERESRAITRLLHEARLPQMKTLEAFEFDRSSVSAGQLHTLADGDYVTRAESILLVGEAGTGKTHLATGLCVAVCRQRRRVRFTTATALINELAEAAHANQLSRGLSRWERLDLICSDELGYVPLAETACELMFQVIADRAEKAAVIVTTNLPFSEWSQVIPSPRLQSADRSAD